MGMWRIVVVIMFGGGLLCFFGYRLYGVSAGPSSRPLQVELADIEKGKPPGNKHIRIGPHYRCFSPSFLQYKFLSEDQEPDKYTEVKWLYYPVFSVESQFGRQIDILTKKYGGFEKWAENLDDSELPPADNLCMIVKTNEYKWVEKLPQRIIRADQIEGLIVNELAPLDSEQKMLFRSQFGHIDFGKVLILEQNRKPSPIAVSLVFMGIGALLFVVPPIVGAKTRKSKLRASKPRAKATADAREPEGVGAPVRPAPTDADNNPYRRMD